jgi:hypothetical protein
MQSAQIGSRSLPLLIVLAGWACSPDAPTGPAAGPAPTVPPDPGPALTIGRVFVDQSGNTGKYTSLAADPSGRQHITYYDATNGDLRYATCASGCTAAGNWTTAVVDYIGDVGQYGDVGPYTSLEVRSARLGVVRHVVYFDATNYATALKYAYCSLGCSLAANWKKVAVDQGGRVGEYASLAIGADGRRHVIYYDDSYARLKYATCLSSCGQAGSWHRSTIDQVGIYYYTSIAVGPDGRRHVTYLRNDGTNITLRYATCLASCSSAANWQTTFIDGIGPETGFFGYQTSVAMGADGVLHVSYGGDYDLRYARCAADCTVAANWLRVTVDATDNRGESTSLAVGTDGRVHVSYYDRTNGDLRYATCAAACQSSTSWVRYRLDGLTLVGNPNVGTFTSLAVDGGGTVHVSYRDETITALKYLERSP